MSILHPPSDERPGDQSSKTPSGKEIPTAMSMMVDSMVRMIQKANKNTSNLDSEEAKDSFDDN
ncbi:hypothetical protein [Prochlorococcus sp. MIT 1307]|uniref:hypothetical protein n=1 Tax=Prochlorococcus sp. MIT 1307 TaxID=3096219 RepID=UPI002A74BC51|nr:hypothetical protein [Prochlorococcus sp. MIT 1307]